MPFIILSNAKIQFAKKKLTWKSYIAKEALPNTQRLELINKKEIAKAALDVNIKTFVRHMSFLSPKSKMTIHPARQA